MASHTKHSAACAQQGLMESSAREVDECASGPCKNGGSCSDFLSGYNCTCQSGFSGSHCETDMDECVIGTHNCSIHAWCSNSEGSFSCSCKSGFLGDGTNCTDEDECATGTHNCSIHAWCSNVEGSFSCSCKSGFWGEGTNCTGCTLFDFENGLSGWIKTGTAFNNQPTYGDNPTARNRGQPSRHKGDWWIGGFEDRPSPSHPAGGTQGDGPQGTLTSPSFVIGGHTFKFLIGGSCRIAEIRAELLVEGNVVLQETGDCNESMTERIWDVTGFKYKEAQLRSWLLRFFSARANVCSNFLTFLVPGLLLNVLTLWWRVETVVMSLTGANTTPLGRLHPILAAKQQGPASPTPGFKRDAGHSDMDVGGGERKKKRKSRWGTEEKRTFIPGMPTTMPPNLSPEQQQAYIAQLKIEEITRMLRTGELGIPDNPDERSPSPEPIYNSEGKRLNTREFRVRKKLEEERHVLIQEAQILNEDYKPPADYKPPIVKIQDKVMIPQDNHPEVNFIGLLIGPRGNTLKKMEKESCAKIMIRGKGSIKEGKIHNGRKDGQPNPGEDEALHALVTGPTEQSVQKAVAMIRDILRQGIEAPEGQNDLKRMQLRELAALNGTLRDDEILRCRNCGSVEHRHWECPEQKNVTNNVLCTKCGAAGHLATDCIQTDLPPIPVVQVDKAKMDSEYMSLMAELGEGPVPEPPVPARLPPPPVEQNRPAITERERPPPRHSTAPLPPPPMQNTNHDRPSSSGPPPWAAPPGPKPLMSTPVPMPGGGPPPPPNSSSAPPWAKPGLLPPPGGPLLGPPHPGGPPPPPPPGGPGSYPPQGPGGHGPPPPPPPSSGAPPPPWQSAGPVPPPPWQSQGPGFAPPPPPGFPPFHGPPLPPPSDSHWAPPPLMGAPPPPPPPPPPGPPPPSS